MNQPKRVKVPVRVAEEEEMSEVSVQQEAAAQVSAPDEPQPAAQQDRIDSVTRKEDVEREVEVEGEATEVDTLEEEVKKLRVELEQARAEAAEYQDRYLRAVAEMDNMRKRLEKRYADQAEQEKRRFLRALLPLVDNLEMVLKHSESDPQVLRQGLEMIVQDLMRTLEAEGVKPIESVGQRFDPFMHEAVEAVQGTDHPPETVVEEVQRGYTYKGELLRPARVRVSRDEE